MNWVAGLRAAIVEDSHSILECGTGAIEAAVEVVRAAVEFLPHWNQSMDEVRPYAERLGLALDALERTTSL